METYSYIHLDAGHDVNGNPRRGFLVFRNATNPDGTTGTGIVRVGYVSEGYAGTGALARVPGIECQYGQPQNTTQLAYVPTTPKYLRELAKECGI